MPFLLFLLTTTCFTAPSVYDGRALDLSRRPVFTLFRGDDSVPAAKDLDMRGLAAALDGQSGRWRVQTEIAIPSELRDAQDIWLFVKSDVAAFDLLLNDRVVIENGRIGQSAADEVGGRYMVSRQIPRDWIKTGTTGADSNTLVIRFSNFQFPNGTHFYDISLGPNGLIESKSGPWVYGPLLLCGVFLLAVCINLSFFAAFKRRPLFLLLAGLFGVCFWAMAEDVLMHRFPVTVAFRHQGVLGGRLDDLAFLLLILAVGWEFRALFLGRKRPFVWVIPLGAVLMVVFLADHALFYFWISLVPLVLALCAWRHRLANGPLLSVALLVFCVLVFGDEADIFDGMAATQQNFVVTSLFYYLDYLGFALLAFVMVTASAGGIIHQNRALDQAQLRGSRLELELLLKHLHPHFLMNALMALQHLLMTDREQAVALVDALAEELHLLRVMSRRRLVTLDEELEICRIHLKIMNMQQRANFQLTVTGVDGAATIPPAVLHTLVENGLTHGYAGRREGVFQLSGETEAGLVRYRLFNDSRAQVDTEPASTGSGTGTAYVRARLEETYPGRWRFQAGAVPGGWEAVVEVPA